MPAVFDAGASYSAHRPSYPDDLPRLLAAAPTHRRLAVDVGCGTGQLTVPLAQHFEQVIGIDPSASQIQSATPAGNVTYVVGTAEDVDVDKQIDLVTVAQAAHWIDDLEAFYARVAQQAAPGSVIALISYGTLRLEGLDEEYQEFYWGDFHRHWDARRHHVENGLVDLPFPFEPVEVTSPDIVRQWDADSFISYLQTWSAAKNAEAAGSDELERFAHLLRQRWGDGTREVRWPVTVRAGRLRA